MPVPPFSRAGGGQDDRDRETQGTGETAMGHFPVRAARGTALSARGWPQEAALRMLANSLDPEVHNLDQKS